MDENFKPATQNEELGFLARASQKIKLQKAEDDKRQLPAQSGGSNAGTPAPDNDPSSKRRKSSMSNYRLGGALCICLLAVIAFSPLIEKLHYTVLTNIASASQPYMGENNYFMSEYDFAMHMPAEQQAAYLQNDLIPRLSAKYGAADQRVVFLKLTLVKLRPDDNSLAIVKDQLPYLKEPNQKGPPEMTSLLLWLARNYDQRETRELSREYFLAALRFWQIAPACDTISNCMSDLAYVDEELNKPAEANEYYRKAYALTKDWGNTDYNTYRLYKIAKTYNDIGNYKEAEIYAKKGIEIGKLANSWHESSAADELKRALKGEKNG